MTGQLASLIIDDSHVSFHQGAGRADLAMHLEGLYRNIFSAYAKFDADGKLGDAECYLSVEHGEIAAILFFTRSAGTVYILNQVFALDWTELTAFSAAVFTTYPDIRCIRFEGLQCEIAGLAFPYQQHECIENIVLSLPDSVPAYVNMLGKSTRSSLRRYHKKLLTELDGFRCDFFEKNDIDMLQVEQLISMSSARITSKNRKSSHTEEKTRALIKLLQNAGSVLVATVNGRLCGGVICTVYGGNFFMHVVAHDPAYDAFRLGKVCIFLTIQAAIAQGAKEYHFLWGQFDYKYRFLGKQRNYDRVIIYRSGLSMLRKLPLWLEVALRGYGRKARIWFNKAAVACRDIFKRLVGAD